MVLHRGYLLCLICCTGLNDYKAQNIMHFFIIMFSIKYVWDNALQGVILIVNTYY